MVVEGGRGVMSPLVQREGVKGQDLKLAPGAPVRRDGVWVGR